MEIAAVLAILLAAIILFATDKLPVDLVAVIVLGVLLISGLVTPEEGIAGFSNTATITVAAMFVLGAGLQKTGAVRSLGRMMAHVGRSRFVLLVLVMVVVAAVSAFINNTACVAILLPLVLALCAQTRTPPSKILIPLSFAAQFGGVCTLIGTSTNLVVSSLSDKAGYGAFEMFEMGRMGLILVAAGILYFLLIGQFILPDRGTANQLTEAYQLGSYITELRVMEKSSLIGKTLIESKFGQKHDVTVLEILRESQKLFSPLHEPIREGDVLLVRGKVQDLMDLKASLHLEIEPEFKLADETLRTEELTLAEALVAPGSRLIGRTLARVRFRQKYGSIVLAIHRHAQTLREKINTMRLQPGDALLLLAPLSEVNRMRNDRDFLLLDRVEEPGLRRNKAPLALLILGGVVAVAAFETAPIVITAIIGCIAMVMTRCITLDEAYSAVDWRVIVLLAGVLPLGTALEKTGAARLIVENCLVFVHPLGPTGALAVVYILTLVLTEIMSNTAAAVLMVPIAISAALGMDVSPKPFLMAVMFAASVNFATPVGYQTNLMVYSPGGYRFVDYMKVGIPLDLIFCVLAIHFIPKFWPF